MFLVVVDGCHTTVVVPNDPDLIDILAMRSACSLCLLFPRLLRHHHTLGDPRTPSLDDDDRRPLRLAARDRQDRIVVWDARAWTVLYCLNLDEMRGVASSSGGGVQDLWSTTAPAGTSPPSTALAALHMGDIQQTERALDVRLKELNLIPTWLSSSFSKIHFLLSYWSHDSHIF